MTEQSFTTYEIGNVVVLRLPNIDHRWRMSHNEEPFMLYPDEVTREYIDDKGARYVVSNYCRVYSYKKKAMVKCIPSLYLPTWIKENFTEEELNNEYTKYNMEVISPTNYYKNHREERIAYQKNYRDSNLERVRANEKKYRDANREKILEKAKERRERKKAEMTEEEHERIKAKAREYYRRRKERLAQNGIQVPEVDEVFKDSSSSDGSDNGQGSGILV